MRIENGLVRFDFDDHTGSIRQIKDCRTGREYLTDPHGCRLAKLIAPTADHHTRPLYSHLAGAPRMLKKGDTLTISLLDEDKMKAAVAAHHIAAVVNKSYYGKMEMDDIEITADAAHLDAFFAKPDAAGLFKPLLILKRVDESALPAP